jgi:hypothetical protein
MNEREIQAWNEFAGDLRKKVRGDIQKIDLALASALKILPGLGFQERAELLQIGKAVAQMSTKLAVTFLCIAPEVVSSIDTNVRSIWLKWAMVFAMHSRETLIHFVEKTQAVLNVLPAEVCPFLLDCGLKISSVDPSVSYKYFMSLPRIQREIPMDLFLRWFEGGLSLIHENHSASLAYFSLESRHSWNRVQQNNSSVCLKDVYRPLKLFAQALTGKNLGLRPIRNPDEGGYQPCGPLPCTDGEAIYLPEVMNDLASPDLNFLAFKLATAHQAGYLEFGTFTFQLSMIHGLFSPEYICGCLQKISDKGDELSPLETFFHLFPNEYLAKDIFHLLEGARVDHCLRRHYRGLNKDMDVYLSTAMKTRPDIEFLPLQEAVLESILRMTTLGQSLNTPPGFPYLQSEALFSLINPILRETATVKDSAGATVFLYHCLSDIPQIQLNLPLADLSQAIPPAFNQHFSQPGGMDFMKADASEEKPYQGITPLPYRGELHPELVQKKIRLREVEDLLNQMEKGIPLPPEALMELLEKLMDGELEISQGQSGEGFQGLFVTDLEGLKKTLTYDQATQRVLTKLKGELRSLLEDVGGDSYESDYYYDEWDYKISDYRLKWCRLKEQEVEVGTTQFVDQTLETYFHLLSEVRKQFQILKPERLKKVPHLERGEEIDLNAAIEASIDRKAGQSASDKVYIEKNRKDRDFSTLFLLDMSASTDQWVEGDGHKPGLHSEQEKKKKVIDIEKEALVVMAEALKEIGDEYAIFGFSGYGRKDVVFYSVKDFKETYGEQVKGRIGKIKSQSSTRMGPVIRHAIEKMSGLESKVKNIILISDGYPQDCDYGDDRTDEEYALQDTMVAFEEASRKNIHFFCITVDRAGHDYLRKIMPSSSYLVIEETVDLPRQLPKIYRRLTT